MRKTDVVKIVLVLTKVVLLATLLTLTVQWTHIRRELVNVTEERICVQCGSLSEKDPEKSDSDICCGTSRVILKDLIGKFSNEKYTKRNQRKALGYYDNKLCPRTVSQTAAVMVSGLNREAQGTEKTHLIIFRDVPNPANDHFVYDKGKLHVKKTDFYYISARIKIKHNSSEADVFRLWIEHFSNTGMTATILENWKSPCGMPTTGEVTLMIGAVVKLSEGDAVCAMTSHPGHLSLADHDYSFGMYSIGS